MRILLVEDEEGVIRFLSKGLREENFVVDTAESGEIALDILKSYNYDLIILDILLPKMSGFEFLTKLRQKNKDMPVLILTAKDTIADKRVGFQGGCDDYLTKPFHFEELLLRIHALLRRNHKTDTPVQVGSIILNPDTFQVQIGEKAVSLTKKEFALLHYLSINAGKFLSRAQILNHVWESPFDTGSNVVDVTINSLRKKIQQDDNGPKIVSMYGVGYALQE